MVWLVARSILHKDQFFPILFLSLSNNECPLHSASWANNVTSSKHCIQNHHVLSVYRAFVFINKELFLCSPTVKALYSSVWAHSESWTTTDIQINKHVLKMSTWHKMVVKTCCFHSVFLLTIYKFILGCYIIKYKSLLKVIHATCLF